MNATEQIRHNEAALERLNQMGVPVETQASPWWTRGRDWQAEAYLDVWVGLYARNLCDNRSLVMGGKNIGCLWGLAAQQVPVAVVGGGPSLDKNVEALRDFPGLIVACDRAARALTARRIRPDLVVAVDPRPELIADFVDYAESRDQVLVACALVNPDVIQRWRGTVLWTAVYHYGTQFFDEIMPALVPGLPGLHAVGNVGNTAIELAHGLGASQVVLVGQDYAYTGGRMHCDEWHQDAATLAWSRAPKNRDEHAQALERRSGKVTIDGEVTYEHFTHYRETLRKLVAENKIDMVNCTEGGILIDYRRMPLAVYNSNTEVTQSALSTARARLAQAIGRKL